MSLDESNNSNSNSNNNSKYTPNDDIETILLKFDITSMGLGSQEPFVVRVKPKTKWEKVITAFGRQFGVNTKAYRFSFDGEQIHWDNKEKVGATLTGIDKEEATEGVKIDVHAESLGGNNNYNYYYNNNNTQYKPYN